MNQETKDPLFLKNTNLHITDRILFHPKLWLVIGAINSAKHLTTGGG